jgi:3',5'-cyclic AMP phosphodiesterase CpdA
LRAVERFVDERRPDAVVVTGDISRDGLQSELDAACNWMRSLPAPVLVTPGNHDVPYYNVVGRVLFPWTRYERAAAGLQQAAWHTEAFSIVPVNTARGWQMRWNWAQGEISRGQTATAAAGLQRAAPGALRIVVTHHPLDWPNDAPIHGVTRGGVRALERLIDAGAELFLSGHLHFASARLIGTRALSITSGTLSQRVRHEPCAFTVVRRPAQNILEAEVVHVVQGVAETASTRQFTLSAPLLPGVPAEVHASSERTTATRTG